MSAGSTSPRAQFHALRWSTSHAYSQVLYADRMVGAEGQAPVDAKKLGRGERRLQAEEKEAQRIIRELHDDEYVGGGVPELHTLKSLTHSLTPSGLKLLAKKCGEQGLDTAELCPGVISKPSRRLVSKVS